MGNSITEPTGPGRCASIFTEYMYLSSGKGSGKRRIARGLLRNVKSSRNVSSGLNATLTYVSPSEVQDQLPTSSPRHARHDHPTRRLLLVGQIVIVVDELAIEIEHVGSTEPADATTAQVRNLHTGGLDTFEETLVGDNMHIEIGLRQVHIERLTRGRRAELLPVDVALRP